MRTVAALVFLLASACDIYYPGDGRLVLVRVDQQIEGQLVPTDRGPVTVGEVVRDGIRWWDAAGARFRTQDQLERAEIQEARGAPQLFFRGGSTRNNWFGSYSPVDGEATLFVNRWSFGPEERVAAVAAHEVGHAMGLFHDQDPEAVMYMYARRTWGGLAEADFEQMTRTWPGPTTPPGR